MDITTAFALILAHQYDLTEFNPHHQREAMLTVERHVLDFKRAELLEDVRQTTERTLQRFRSSSPHLFGEESLEPSNRRLTALLAKSDAVRRQTGNVFPHFAAAESALPPSDAAPKEEASEAPPGILTGP